MRIAIVHDYLNDLGGAERVLRVLHEMYPDAPVYTSIYDREKMLSWGWDDSGWDIRETFMKNLPLVYRFYKYYFFAYPFAFESLDLSSYDVVISSASYAAKGVKVRKPAIHICYCYTPPRFLWGYDTELHHQKFPFFYRWGIYAWRWWLKRWDYQKAQGIDYFLAISKTVAERIYKNYGRKADAVIYPPVDLERFATPPDSQTTEQPNNYFLVVSRLGGYKRIDIVVEAFNKLGLPLKIVGIGPAEDDLKKRAGPNIEFLGRLPDNEVTKLYFGCRALIFPTEEDFGLTPLEAQAAGKPVIAYLGGGALETVIEGVTGEFFFPQTSEALIKVLGNFDLRKYDPEKCRENAERFNRESFVKSFSSFLTSANKVSRPAGGGRGPSFLPDGDKVSPPATA